MIMNFEVQAERVSNNNNNNNMDPPPPPSAATVQTPPSDQHLCYVRCNFCNTLLAVGIPCKRLLDTVTVKCGHCSNLSFLTISRASPPPPAPDHHHPLQPHPSFSPFQGGGGSGFSISSDQYLKSRRGGQSSSSSSSTTTSNEPTSPKAPPFVVKPPEKKHRLPSAYNRFMKEEIQRIKASNPQIPHREAFSTAAKNWAGHIPNGSNISGSINTD